MLSKRALEIGDRALKDEHTVLDEASRHSPFDVSGAPMVTVHPHDRGDRPVDDRHVMDPHYAELSAVVARAEANRAEMSRLTSPAI